VVSRHFVHLDAVVEFDASNDFRQLVFSFQSPPGFHGSGDGSAPRTAATTAQQGTTDR
jgi:hypothetical protein